MIVIYADDRPPEFEQVFEFDPVDMIYRVLKDGKRSFSPQWRAIRHHDLHNFETYAASPEADFWEWVGQDT